jgi:membrane protein DedA with SNARE-associated domain
MAENICGGVVSVFFGFIFLIYFGREVPYQEAGDSLFALAFAIAGAIMIILGIRYIVVGLKKKKVF